MPKIKKEVRDQIVKLLKEGYTNVETAEKTGVSKNTVSKMKKKLVESEKTDHGDITKLSKDSMGKIFNLQGMLGVDSIDKAINIIYDDFMTIMPLKYEYDLDFSKTPGKVFKEIVNKLKEKEKHVNNIMKGKGNTWIQTTVLKMWGMDWTVKALYDYIYLTQNYEGSLLDFLELGVIGSFKSKGWKFDQYYNEQIKENLPILINPTGSRLTFPFSEQESSTEKN